MIRSASIGVLLAVSVGCGRGDGSAQLVEGPGDPCPSGIDVPPVEGGWEPLDEAPTFRDLAHATEFIGADTAALPPELLDAPVQVEFSSFSGGGLVRADYGVQGDVEDVIATTAERIEASGAPHFSHGPYPKEPGDPERKQTWEVTPPSGDPEFAPKLVISVRGCSGEGVSLFGSVWFGPEFLGDCAPAERRAACMQLYQQVPHLGPPSDERPRRVRLLPDGRLEVRADGIEGYADSVLGLLRHRWNVDPADVDADLPTDEASTFDLMSTIDGPPLRMRLVFTPLSDDADGPYRIQATVRTVHPIGAPGT